MRGGDSIPVSPFFFEIVGRVIGTWKITDCLTPGLGLFHDEYLIFEDGHDEFVARLHFESFAGFLRDDDLVFG